MRKYIVFLRGINVGGHHKVPMAELSAELKKLDFENIVTILNSGNILLDALSENIDELEDIISKHLEHYFGFSIPTIVRESEMISDLISNNPFKDVELTKDIRLYLSFLKKNIETDLQFPWISTDESFRIISFKDKIILSVLDLSKSKTSKAMGIIEKSFGADITTRNWNTIERINNKI